MKESSKKKILRNGIASVLQKGVKIFEQLILVPFFISSWGAAYYGEWLALTIIPTILAFSDLGFGSAVANTFVLKFASNDIEGASNVARSGFFAITILILGSVLVSFIAMFFLTYLGVFEKSIIDSKQAIIAVSFLLLGRFLNFYQQLFEAYFRALRKADISINLLTGYSSFLVISSILVLFNGGGIVLFAFMNFIVTLIFIVAYAIYAKNVMAKYYNLQGKVNEQDIRLIFKKGISYLMSPIWQAIFFQGTTFVVRIILGPESVAVFNTVRTLTRSINQAYSALIVAAVPEMQLEIGAKNMEKARKIFRAILLLVIIIAFLGSILLFLFGSEFYELWTQKSLNPPKAMWNIFIISILFNAIWWTSSYVFQAVNKPRDFAVAGVVCSVIAVSVSYFLSIKYGLVGAAVGSFVMDFLLLFYVLPKSCELMGQSLKKIIIDFYVDFKIFVKKKIN